jgi:pentatricopeptide repeat protein
MLDEMSAREVSPDENILNNYNEGIIVEETIDTALEIKGRMLQEGSKLTNLTINLLIQGFCRRGHIEEALALIQKESTNGLITDKFLLISLLNGICKAGYVKQAVSVLNDMINAGLHPDMTTYNTFIDHLCKKNDTEEALALLHKMEDKGHGGGRVMEAADFLVEMVKGNIF